MGEVSDLLDRAIPDRVPTGELTLVEAAEVDFLAGRPQAWVHARDGVPAGVRARALVQAGDRPGARQALRAVADEPASTQATAAAVWAGSRAGLGELAAVLRSRVDSMDPGFVFESSTPLGTKAILSGLLAMTAGDLDAARRDLAEAVSEGDRRAPVWGARARLELARLLCTIAATEAGPDEDVAGAGTKARQLLTSAEAFFAAGGYHHLRGCARSLGDAPAVHDLAEPTLGHLVPGSRWAVGFGVQPWTDVGARKGLVALRHLVVHRHRPVPAVELVAVLDGIDFETSALADLEVLAQGRPLEDADLSVALRDLLLDDRARSRASKLLRRTISGLGQQHPALARHLEATVRTGYACRYEACASTVWRT